MELEHYGHFIWYDIIIELIKSTIEKHLKIVTVGWKEKLREGGDRQTDKQTDRERLNIYIYYLI